MRSKLNTINSCDIYIITWAMFNLKGFLYPEGLLSSIIRYVMLMWGLYLFIIYILRKQKSPFLNTVLFLLLMFVLYGFDYQYSNRIVYNFKGEPLSAKIYILTFLESLIPMFVFYYYSINKKLTEKRFLFYIPLFVLMSIISYYLTLRDMLMASIGIETEMINNSSYDFLSILPLLFFVKKRLYRYILAAIIIVFIVLSFKRGAILLGLLSLVFIIIQDVKVSSPKNKVRALFLAFLSFFCLFLFISDMMSSNDYFADRIYSALEGNSSGRDEIAISILDGFFNNSTILQYVFGHGANSTILFGGHLAHNDWIETMCNNGFFGVSLLFLFFIQAVIMVRKVKKSNCRSFYMASKLLVFITFFKTFFSMSIQDMYISQNILWGYLCYLTIQNTKLSKKTQRNVYGQNTCVD